MKDAMVVTHPLSPVLAVGCPSVFATIVQNYCLLLQHALLKFLYCMFVGVGK